MANAKINFPVTGVTVNGGGGLFAWGTFDTTVITGPIVQNTSTWNVYDATTNAQLANGQLAYGHPQPCNWYAQIDNVPLGGSSRSVYLSITINDNQGHQATDQTGNFTLAGKLTLEDLARRLETLEQKVDRLINGADPEN